MNRINAPFELKNADSKGHFKGYVAVFDNVDLGRDVIEKGAFKKFKTTKDGQIRIALNHDLRQLAGKAKFTQDDHGLLLDGKLNLNVSYVKDAYELMKDGTLDGMSVGFDIMSGGWRYEENENKDLIRYISKAELWEGSIVPFGMNPEAKVEDIKQYNKCDIHRLEKVAQDHGCSRKSALAIANTFKEYLSDSGLLIPQSDSEVSRVSLDEIKTLFEKFK